jgi:hypothetical protein
MSLLPLTYYCKRAAVIACGVLLVVGAAKGVYGQVMSSVHYRLNSDSLNFGGANSTSSSYTIEDTMGEIATGFSSSTNYSINAGYQAMNLVAISLVPPGSVTLSPSIGGVSGGTSDGSTNFTVTTDDSAGYASTLVASTSPALVGPYGTFADYVPGGSAPDFTFAISPSASAFGFSAQGTDADQRFKNDGSVCNAGANSTIRTCWDGLSTSPKTVADRTSANQPSGTLTNLYFRAKSGPANIQPDGTYIATRTLTITPL